MSVLVTGGAGYIGSHTCVSLLASGLSVVAVDNFSNSSPSVVGRIEAAAGRSCPFYPVDILEEDAMRAVFQKEKIDGVIHFAAFKSPQASLEDPLSYYLNNISGTISLCRVMLEFGCKKLVFSSSATVYGMQNAVPNTEEMPLGQALNPYGTTKIMMEKILTDLGACDEDWSVALLRYFNPIGAHASGRIGDDPNGVPANIMPIVLRVAAGKQEKLSVFGADYDTPDGTCIRDYIHVCDLAEGHVKALSYVNAHKGVEAFNLGTGRGTSVLELINTFARVNRVDVPYAIAPRRPGDLPVSYADVAKAKRVLGFEAARSLEDMCRDAWTFACQ